MINRNIRVVNLLVFLALLSTACSFEARAELKKNKEIWLAHEIRNYQYDLEPVYFGDVIYLYKYPLTVIVLNGQPVSVRDKTGMELEQKHKEDIKEYSTIDGVLSFVENAINSNPDKLNISYDPVYGFPALVDIYYHFGVTDDGIRLTITNFKELK